MTGSDNARRWNSAGGFYIGGINAAGPPPAANARHSSIPERKDRHCLAGAPILGPKAGRPRALHEPTTYIVFMYALLEAFPHTRCKSAIRSIIAHKNSPANRNSAKLAKTDVPHFSRERIKKGRKRQIVSCLLIIKTVNRYREIRPDEPVSGKLPRLPSQLSCSGQSKPQREAAQSTLRSHSPR